jgi:hypothetical protein
MSLEALPITPEITVAQTGFPVRRKIGLWVGKLFMSESRANGDDRRITNVLGVTLGVMSAIALTKGLQLGEVGIHRQSGELPELQSAHAEGPAVITSGEYSPGIVLGVAQNRINRRGGIY